MKTISQIKLELQNLILQNNNLNVLYTLAKLTEFICKYKNDSRTGVKNIVKLACNKQEKLNLKVQKFENLNQYENKLYLEGQKYIAGVDEVGRGPLAGPVITAAVILDKNIKIYGIDDSKKLTETKRNQLFRIILQKALSISISKKDNNLIDNINILNATINSMEEAVNNLNKKPDCLIIDAISLPNVKIKQLNIVKADEKSVSVAAASIIAKVTRDKIMDKYDKVYPMYNFSKNKGYGTKDHIEAIKKYGPCPIHRKTFLKNLIKY